MLKKIKRLFNKGPVNNDKGSALAVALIVIVVLTFSLATITSMSVNLAGATTLKLNQVNEDSYAQGVIRQSIAEYEFFINDGGLYNDFDNVEIPRIFADYGVIVTDVTGTGDFIDYGVFGTIESRVYKFAYPMTDGDVMVKYSFVSNYGSSVETFEPFDYSIGTNGKLILNGGEYNDVFLYGEEVLLASRAPYIFNGQQRLTPSSSASYPKLGDSTIFQELGYKYCISGCFQTNTILSPFVIVQSNYVDVIGSSLVDQGTLSPMFINDFFGEFNFDEFIFEYIKTEAPTGGTVLTDNFTLATPYTAEEYIDFLVQVIRDNSGALGGTAKKPIIPNTPFVDITNHPGYDFFNTKKDRVTDFAAFWDGDLSFNSGVTTNVADEAFIINGDLTIDADGPGNSTSRFKGSFVVLGDLYLTGETIDMEGSFIVMGQTFINFDDGEGISITGNNKGLTILNKDNIIINRISETTRTAAFIYTEESIYIDVVDSAFDFEGSLFARALGVSGNNIFLNDNLGVPINGIVINSYIGYINNSGVAVPDGNDNFIASKIASVNYVTKFINIPTFDSLVTSEGIYTFGTSEWSLE